VLAVQVVIALAVALAATTLPQQAKAVREAEVEPVRLEPATELAA